MCCRWLDSGGGGGGPYEPTVGSTLVAPCPARAPWAEGTRGRGQSSGFSKLWVSKSRGYTGGTRDHEGGAHSGPLRPPPESSQPYMAVTFVTKISSEKFDDDSGADFAVGPVTEYCKMQTIEGTLHSLERLARNRILQPWSTQEQAIPRLFYSTCTQRGLYLRITSIVII